MIFSDPFYSIHSGEIFSKSQCMRHEHELADFLHDVLLQQGYMPRSKDKRVWEKENHQIVTVLADDFGVCRTNQVEQPYRWFSDHTVVITDNYMPHKTQYKICQLPQSYFGIFYYKPLNQNFNPSSRFNLSINRIDHQRLLIFLEFLKQFDNAFAQDLINFNARDPDSDNTDADNLILNFEKYFGSLTAEFQNSYRDHTDIKTRLPLRNHDMSIEQAHVSAYVNLVIETYAGNFSIAFSEKIFRALLTPAPWTLFSAQNAVSYLRSMGFDVLDDIVDHSYDSVKQTWPYGINKIQQYLKCSMNTYQQASSMPAQILRDRCVRAATNNQQLLHQFKQNWPKDFASWLENTIKFLQ